MSNQLGTATLAGPAIASIWRRHRAWLLVGLALLLVVVVRVRLREMPLERDEGEYAFAGQLMLQGVPPYREAFNMKLPGTYAAYAVIMALFGQTPSGIHLGVTLVNCACIMLLFLVARRTLDPPAAVVAATCFALMSMSPYLLGLAGHATHFVTLFALGGVYLLLLASTKPRLGVAVAAGVCFGGAFLMKQHGVFFIFFGLIYYTWIWVVQRRHTRELETSNRVGGRTRKKSAAKQRAPVSAMNQESRQAQPSTSPAPTPVRRLSHLAAAKLQQAAAERQSLSQATTQNPPLPPSEVRPETLPQETAPQQNVPSEPTFEPAPANPKPGTGSGLTRMPTGAIPVSTPDFSADGEIANSRKRERQLLRYLLVLGGAAVFPYALTCLVLWGTGDFPEFWFWTVTYAGRYATAMPLEKGLRLLGSMLRAVSSPDLPLWLLPIGGVLFLWWDKRITANARFLLLSLAACALGSVSVGFYFREHYFIPLLPVLGLFSGLAVSRSLYLLRHDRSLELFLAIPVLLLFIGGVGAALLGNGGVWFTMPPAQASRYIYGSTLFADTAKAADFLKANSKPGERIALLGSEPQVFFYANRPSATGYIYMYPMMESHAYAIEMQKDLIRRIERVKPEWYVFVNDPYSWAPDEDSPKQIDNWWAPFWQANLDFVMSFRVERGFEQLSSLPILEENTRQERQGAVSQIMIFRSKKVANDPR